MTKIGHFIQRISTKRTDFHTDRVLILGQVTEKTREILAVLHFLKFLFAAAQMAHLVFPKHKSTIRKTKRAIFCQRTFENVENILITFYLAK